MIPAFTREIPDNEAQTLKYQLKKNRVPSKSLTTFASVGTPYYTFRLEAPNGDGFLVSPIPDEKLQIVSHNEPKTIESGFIIERQQEDEAAFITSELANKLRFLPTLKQAFHENNNVKYKYHFGDGSTEPAELNPQPVSRLDEPVSITAIEYIGGEFPKQFIIETKDDGCMYLRERSGTIKLYDELHDGELIFHAFIGKEHPGTKLTPNEVINIITGVDYINTSSDVSNTVSKETREKYQNMEGSPVTITPNEDGSINYEGIYQED